MTALQDPFKAYDIRGRVPDELSAELAYSIGQTLVSLLDARQVVVGWDVRENGPPLVAALEKGMAAVGADVHRIGQCGTEEVYFAVHHWNMDAGVMVTASHNPPDYNGMKIVREGARPVSADTGLLELRRLSQLGVQKSGPKRGRVYDLAHRDAYLEHLLSWVDGTALRPFKVVTDAGNGGAGELVDLLDKHLPLEFIRLRHEPDGSFPHGVPNPLLPENRHLTSKAVCEHGANFGIAWDGDFDRCFFFDEHGDFIEGYYLVGLLAGVFLERYPGATIIHDPRLLWNTCEVVAAAGGQAVQSKAGHAFIKEAMRREDAVYGGEMSAHHYFRDFAYCDSGMIPWLLVAELMSRTGRPLSELVAERAARFPVSGEINRQVSDTGETIARIRGRYENTALSIDQQDGLSMCFDDWRFNVRPSNTEPLCRLNVETRGDVALLQRRTDELLQQITPEDGSS